MAAAPGGAAGNVVLHTGTLMQFKFAERLRPQDDELDQVKSSRGSRVRPSLAEPQRVFFWLLFCHTKK